ncbi:hypothetical protein BLNAU_21904 [Blattamonas nauphoetae]|uniref:Uncharacterized protein n=1 Tax=Blattamonas nauphoetae TaxID=2049346 RepID=A0ABQ9WUJ5_9EUKA|nr:hypothetical protein BLNAU_21904 [Blattamonas nauphoetae]
MVNVLMMFYFAFNLAFVLFIPQTVCTSVGRTHWPPYKRARDDPDYTEEWDEEDEAEGKEKNTPDDAQIQPPPLSLLQPDYPQQVNPNGQFGQPRNIAVAVQDLRFECISPTNSGFHLFFSHPNGLPVTPFESGIRRHPSIDRLVDVRHKRQMETGWSHDCGQRENIVADTGTGRIQKSSRTNTASRQIINQRTVYKD